MKNLISRLLTGLAAGALATAIAWSAPAQAAADTYTPHGGPVSIFATDASFTVVEANATFTCAALGLHGTVVDTEVSRPFGATATTWGGLEASGCTNPIVGAVTVNPVGIWGFAITGAEVGSISPAALTGIGLFVEANGCSFYIAGELSGDYDDVSGLFTVTGSTLAIAGDPAGFLCSVIGVAQGQSVSTSDTWLISGLTITNP